MRFIAMLRGINVGGRSKVPMAELRALCGGLGWRDVQSYIQSGNLVFEADGSPDGLELVLEREIQRRMALAVPVIVRSAAAWPSYLLGNPYPEASRSAPNLVMLALSKAPPAVGAAEALRGRAVNGERIVRVDDALWIHYPDGAGRSKLSPGLLDRFVGSPVTTRNWRTVLMLDEMIRPSAADA